MEELNTQMQSMKLPSRLRNRITLLHQTIHKEGLHLEHKIDVKNTRLEQEITLF